MYAGTLGTLKCLKHGRIMRQQASGHRRVCGRERHTQTLLCLLVITQGCDSLCLCSIPQPSLDLSWRRMSVLFSVSLCRYFFFLSLWSF